MSYARRSRNLFAGTFLSPLPWGLKAGSRHTNDEMLYPDRYALSPHIRRFPFWLKFSSPKYATKHTRFSLLKRSTTTTTKSMRLTYVLLHRATHTVHTHLSTYTKHTHTLPTVSDTHTDGLCAAEAVCERERVGDYGALSRRVCVSETVGQGPGGRIHREHGRRTENTHTHTHTHTHECCWHTELYDRGDGFFGTTFSRLNAALAMILDA